MTDWQEFFQSIDWVVASALMIELVSSGKFPIPASQLHILG